MSTKDKIINVAERAFAEKGFAQTSLREITAKANVNVAAVNYHFGNKKNLIQAVFKRYFDTFMPELQSSLSSVKEEDSALDVLMLCVPPLQSLDKVRPQGCALFLLLLGRGYNEVQGHLRRFIQVEYGEELQLLVSSIAKSVPWVTKETLFWRLHFALGSLVFTIAAQTALSEIVEADFQHGTNSNDILRLLLPFIAQGISAA